MNQRLTAQAKKWFGPAAYPAATTPTPFAVERDALHVVAPTHSTAARLDGRDGPR